MISRVLAADLPAHVGEQVRIAGWLHRRRELKSVTFLIVRDRSGLAQVVLSRLPVRDAAPTAGCPRKPWSRSRARSWRTTRRPAESSSPGRGSRRCPARPRRRRSTCTGPSVTGHACRRSSTTRRSALRHPVLRAGFEIAAATVAGFRAALDGLGFTEIHTPKIVESATESGANVFGLDYFGRPAYLAQSPQFYKQTMVGVFERVFEAGPAFRAEPHDTARHLAEYTSLDAELGFVADHHDVMAVLREAVAGMVGRRGRAGRAAPPSCSG